MPLVRRTIKSPWTLTLALLACTPTTVVEPRPITIVLPAPSAAQCDDVERVLVEDELAQADAGEEP